MDRDGIVHANANALGSQLFQHSVAVFGADRVLVENVLAADPHFGWLNPWHSAQTAAQKRRVFLPLLVPAIQFL